MSQAEIAQLRAEAATAERKQRAWVAAIKRERLAKEALERVGTAPLGSTVETDLDSFLALRSVYRALVEPVGPDMVVVGRTVTYRATRHPAERPVFG